MTTGDFVSRLSIATVWAVVTGASFAAADANIVPPPKTEANVAMEMTFEAAQPHPDPFLKTELDVVFTDPAGAPRTVPAFWAGGNQWKVRYASPLVGTHRYRSQCSDSSDTGLHGIEGQVEIMPYTGTNPLYRHGPVRVAQDHRHFAHADGTPFFWLGDTWWKRLCKRMTWEGFQELTADRKAKGFTVVQIVCGLIPMKACLKPRWENEGGKPYLTGNSPRSIPPTSSMPTAASSTWSIRASSRRSSAAGAAATATA